MTPADREMLLVGAGQVGVELTPENAESFEIFTAELLRWNAKLNLTSLDRPADIITKHYIDSLTICNMLPAGTRLLDIGSGGGFPSIPLKIVRPDLDILSVDSVLKKINFQKQVARLLGFKKFSARHARVEDLVTDFTDSFDFVVARAVSDLVALAKLALPFLAENGRLIAMKGSRWREELADAEGNLDGLGFLVAETKELRLPIINDGRGIIILQRKKAELS